MAKETKQSTDKKQPKQEYNPIKDLEKHEYAFLAANLMGERSRAGYALPAMRQFYFKTLGMDQNDPILGAAFARASTGVASGQIADEGVLKAINLYSGNYSKAFGAAKVSQIMSYLASRKTTELPKNVGNIVSACNGVAYSDLVKTDSPVAKLAVEVIRALQEEAVEATLAPKMVRESTQEHINGLEERLSEIAEKAPKK